MPNGACVKIFKQNNSVISDYIKAFEEITNNQIKNEEKIIIDFAEFISQIKIILNFRLQRIGIDFQINIKPRVFFKSYPRLISQVVQNIAINAIEHGFEKKRNKKKNITIAYSLNEQLLTLTISNNGTPIPSEIIPRIFEKNFKSKSTIGRVGLYNVKRIIEVDLRGTISCV